MMEFEETSEYKNYIAKIEDKAKTIIRGDDVIHLHYLSPLVDESCLMELKNDFENVKIRLSSFDDFGVIKASLEDFSLQIFLSISNPISLEILKTIGLNSIWEVLKLSVLKLHSKIFNRSSEQSAQISNKINFGFIVKVNDEISYEFKLDGDLSDDLILKTMDKALGFIKEQDGQSIPVLELPVVCRYDKKKGKWKKFNIIDEIKKNKDRNKKKK